MTKYVCGLLFDMELKLVVLIEKLKPNWQKGFWNAVGGKIEENESPYDAMVREFKEEAGLEILDWKTFATLRGSRSEIFMFYSTIDAKKIVDVKTLTEEQVAICTIENTLMSSLPLIANMKWLIPMAINSIRDNRREVFNIWAENPGNPGA